MPKKNSCALLAEPEHSFAEGARLLLAILFDAVVIVGELSLIEVAGTSRFRDISAGSKWILPERSRSPRSPGRVLAAAADGFLVKRRIGTELIPLVEPFFRGERHSLEGVR